VNTAHRNNDFSALLKNLARYRSEKIILDYQNNYVERSSIMSKKF